MEQIYFLTVIPGEDPTPTLMTSFSLFKKPYLQMQLHWKEWLQHKILGVGDTIQSTVCDGLVYVPPFQTQKYASLFPLAS